MKNRRRYRAWYFPIIIDAYIKYDVLADDEAETTQRIIHAIDTTTTKYKTTEEGKATIKAMDLIYKDNKYNFEGVAQQLYVSKSKLHRMIRSFVDDIAKLSGF